MKKNLKDVNDKNNLIKKYLSKNQLYILQYLFRKIDTKEVENFTNVLDDKINECLAKLEPISNHLFINKY